MRSHITLGAHYARHMISNRLYLKEGQPPKDLQKKKTNNNVKTINKYKY